MPIIMSSTSSGKTKPYKELPALCEITRLAQLCRTEVSSPEIRRRPDNYCNRRQSKRGHSGTYFCCEYVFTSVTLTTLLCHGIGRPMSCSHNWWLFCQSMHYCCQTVDIHILHKFHVDYFAVPWH